MHPDEYRAHLERDLDAHRTRSNRRPDDADWIEELADRILDRLRCRHPLVVDSTCTACGDRLTSEELL